MSDIKEHTERSQESYGDNTPRWMSLAVVALAALSVLSLGVGWSAANRAGNVEQSLTARAATLDQTSALLSKRLSQAEDTNAQLKGDLGVVTDRLKLTQGELSRARKATKEFKEAYSQQLSDVENSVKTELATKASADDVNSKVGAINGDIAGVRTELDSTKQNLQMARGEFGTLIARNHEEIEQLRRAGQRDYFEFTISKKGERQKLGNNVTVELRGTNVKKNLYTLAFLVDDLRLEKRNRSINEPIYFYTRGGRAPFELVVNQVGKDKVVGYMSTPKAGATGATSGL